MKRITEATIGFTILGHSNKNPITLDGANHDDLIILTKPIGTGTILAGEMQGLAKGLWIKNAQEWMMKSQGSVIKFLSNKKELYGFKTNLDSRSVDDLIFYSIIGCLSLILQ